MDERQPMQWAKNNHKNTSTNNGSQNTTQKPHSKPRVNSNQTSFYEEIVSDITKRN